MHLNASSIPVSHGLVQAGIALGRTTYGSPTPFRSIGFGCKSLKLGLVTLRSHSMTIYIYT
jgi:acetylornithine deacetylase